MAPYELVQRMRASIQIMGPLVARFGQARVAMPGGCNLGPRKLDFHLRGSRAAGGGGHPGPRLRRGHGRPAQGFDHRPGLSQRGRHREPADGLRLAEGTTVIENAAREPEIVDLGKFLVQHGGRDRGGGDALLVVHGVTELHSAEHTVMGDRIEAGTFLIAGAVTGGDVEVEGISPHSLQMFLAKLREIGVQVQENTRKIRAWGDPAYYVATDVSTLPYPGFATDLQAQMMVLLSLAQGVSIVTENVFENRFGFVDELIRLGADIEVTGHHAVVNGGRVLTGATVIASRSARRGGAGAGRSGGRRDDRSARYRTHRSRLRMLRRQAPRPGRRPRAGGATLAVSLRQARISRASVPPRRPSLSQKPYTLYYVAGHKPRRWPRVLLWIAVMLVLVAAVSAGGLYLWANYAGREDPHHRSGGRRGAHHATTDRRDHARPPNRRDRVP